MLFGFEGRNEQEIERSRTHLQGHAKRMSSIPWQSRLQAGTDLPLPPPEGRGQGEVCPGLKSTLPMEVCPCLKSSLPMEVQPNKRAITALYSLLPKLAWSNSQKMALHTIPVLDKIDSIS
jgi:hypothetical protein